MREKKLMNSFFNNVIAFVIRHVFLSYIEGEEFIDSSEPVIIVANHNSYLDHFFLLLLFRKYWKSNSLFFLTKSEAFQKPISRIWHEIMNSVPVDRRSGGREGLNKLRYILENEIGSVAIYPEGTRSSVGMLGDGKKGAVLLAALTGRKILPVGLENTFDILPKKRRLPSLNKGIIRVGNPIEVNGTDKSEITQKHNHLMESLSKLSNENKILSEVKNNEIEAIQYYMTYYNELGIRNYPTTRISQNLLHKRVLYLSNRLLADKIENSEIYYERSRAYGRLGLNSNNVMYRIGMLMLTEKNAKKAIALDDSFAPAYYVLANYYLALAAIVPIRKYEKTALELFEIANEKSTKSINIKMGYAKLLIKLHNFDNSKLLLHEVLSIEAKNLVDFRRQLEAEVLLMRLDKNYVPQNKQ